MYPAKAAMSASIPTGNAGMAGMAGNAGMAGMAGMAGTATTDGSIERTSESELVHTDPDKPAECGPTDTRDPSASALEDVKISKSVALSGAQEQFSEASSSQFVAAMSLNLSSIKQDKSFSPKKSPRTPRSHLPKSPFKVSNKKWKNGNKSPRPSTTNLSMVPPTSGGKDGSGSGSGVSGTAAGAGIGIGTDAGYLGTVASSFSTANVLALAIRELGNVADSERELVLWFNSHHEITRIESYGDL
jgi:hypothetical protein